MLTAFTAILSGCDSSAPPQSPHRQDHPVGPFVLQLNGHSFYVELANTPQLIRQGLAGRKYLPPDQGMLFVFPAPIRVTMWMKGCKIPLDVLFFDGKKRLINFHTMAVGFPGQPDHTLPTYPSDKPAKYALEVPADTTARLRLKPGAAIIFSPELLKALDKGTE